MAQTTGALSSVNGKVEFSTNGSSWTDISGFVNSVEPTGGNRQSGEMYTLSGDTAIVTKGKREPIELEVKVVYTEGGSDAFEVVRAAYEAGTSGYVRWSPDAGATGDFLFTSDAGPITEFKYPPAMAEEAGPTAISFKLRVPKVTKSAIA